MARFTAIRGKEAWLEFIRESALKERQSSDTFTAYMKRVAALARHPDKKPQIPSLRDAIRELVKSGELEKFASSQQSKKGDGNSRAGRASRKEKMRKRSQRQESRNGARDNQPPFLGLILDVVELNSQTSRVLASLAKHVGTLAQQVSLLFANSREVEETKQRLREVLREVQEAGETLTE